MWLTGRLAPDFKTIADFRKDNGAAIRACADSSSRFAEGSTLPLAPLLRSTAASSSGEHRDKNYTVARVTGDGAGRRSIARYLRALDQADREESRSRRGQVGRLKEKIAGLRRQMQALR